jgi:hypothetical protein
MPCLLPSQVVVLLLWAAVVAATGSAMVTVPAHNPHNKSQNRDIKSLGQRNLEASIRFYDKDLYQAGIKVADQLDISVRGFYHLSSAHAAHWEDGFEEMMFILDGKRFQHNMFPHTAKMVDKKRLVQQSKLTLGWSAAFEVVDQLNIIVHGSAQAFANVTDRYNSMYMSSGSMKTNLTHVNEPSSSGDKQLDALKEHATSLQQLTAYCRAKTAARQRAFVFYIHNQEACKHDDPLHQSSESYFQSLDVTDSFLVE